MASGSSRTARASGLAPAPAFLSGRPSSFLDYCECAPLLRSFSVLSVPPFVNVTVAFVPSARRSDLTPLTT